MEELLKKFKFSQKVEMRWSDLDELGHVNNAIFLTYFEQGRIGYLEESVQWNWKEYGLIQARAEIDYKQPLYIRDKPVMYIRCSKVGTKSFVIEYIIVNEHDNQLRLVAQGNTVMVMYNYQSRTSTAIPDVLKEKFHKYEKYIA